MNVPPELVIGVDVGGTKILAGVVDREGRVHARTETHSPTTSEHEVLAALDSAVEGLLDDRISALGYGVPSNLERQTRRILRSCNLPLYDVDLVAHARTRFGLPVGIENDGNAAALAENFSATVRGTTPDGRIAVTMDDNHSMPALGAIVIPHPSRRCQALKLQRYSHSTALFHLMAFPRIQGLQRKHLQHHA